MKRLPIKIRVINIIPVTVSTVGLKIVNGLIIYMISMDPIKVINTNIEKNNTLIVFEIEKGTLYCLKTPFFPLQSTWN